MKPSALCLLEEWSGKEGGSFLEKMTAGQAFTALVMVDDKEGTPQPVELALQFRILYILRQRNENVLSVMIDTRGFPLPPGFQHGEYRLKFEGRKCREIPPEMLLSSEGETVSEGEALTDAKFFWKRPMDLTSRRNRK